jgi:hypothetical protein
MIRILEDANISIELQPFSSQRLIQTYQALVVGNPKKET